MTWVIQYDKKKDYVTSDIIMEEFKGSQTVVTMPSTVRLALRRNVVITNNDHEGHRWIMDTGCGSDLISKAEVEDHKMRRSKAKCPIQFQTAIGNAKGVEVATNMVEFDESIEPYVLPDAPSVLSIGRKCMRGGYRVVSRLITPSGKLVALAVKDDTP